MRPGRGEGAPKEPQAEPRQQPRLEQAGPRLRCVAFATPATAARVPRGTRAVTPPSERGTMPVTGFKVVSGSCSTQLRSSVSVTSRALG